MPQINLTSSNIHFLGRLVCLKTPTSKTALAQSLHKIWQYKYDLHRVIYWTKKERFMHSTCISAKVHSFQIFQVRYQTARCPFLFHPVAEELGQLGWMHEIISKCKSTCANSLVKHSLLRDITTNLIHFEHDQILKTVSRSRLNFFDSKVAPM